jgi:hypothetical protein
VWALTDDFVVAYYTEQLGHLPEPEWIVPTVLERSGVTFLVGDFGTGKTFLAIDWCMSLASGLAEWGAWKLPGTPQRVMYILAEGQGWLHHRVQEWYEHHPGAEPGDNIIWIPEALTLFRRDGESNDLRRLSNAAVAFKPDLIVADTFARVTAGANENQQQDMSIIVGAVDTIRSRTGAAVMFLHHANREGNYRGSTVLPGAADVVLNLRRQSEADDSPVELGWIKLKNAQVPTDRPWLRIAAGKYSGYVELLGGPPKKGTPRQDQVVAWLRERDEPFSVSDLAGAVFTDQEDPRLRSKNASKYLTHLVREGWVQRTETRGVYEPVPEKLARE